MSKSDVLFFYAICIATGIIAAFVVTELISHVPSV
jgi:hypothetical protein